VTGNGGGEDMKFAWNNVKEKYSCLQLYSSPHILHFFIKDLQSIESFWSCIWQVKTVKFWKKKQVLAAVQFTFDIEHTLSYMFGICDTVLAKCLTFNFGQTQHIWHLLFDIKSHVTDENAFWVWNKKLLDTFLPAAKAI
jgi:hypothetical protein